MMSISEKGQKKGIRITEYKGQNLKIDKTWGSTWEKEEAAQNILWVDTVHERSREKVNNLKELNVTPKNL